jgi:hypothetical protein
MPKLILITASSPEIRNQPIGLGRVGDFTI